MRRVVLRADADKKTGYGHFIRSLALTAYLKDDFDCHFATYNPTDKLPTDYQLGEIAKVCNYIPIGGASIDEANDDFLNELNHEDIVVLDNYYYSTEYQHKIRNKGCKLVCIDDLHDRHMVCDLLITPSPLRRGDFSLEPSTKFLGGIEWAFLREPFFKPTPIRNISSRINDIVMAMGGADAYDLTNKIARIIHDVIPDANLHVIAGDTVNISAETENMAEIHRQLRAEEIVELMDNSDIGIFPSSTVCIEAFSRRLPVIGGYYVDNQKAFYDYGVNHGYFSQLGNLLDDPCVLGDKLKDIIRGSRPHPVVMDFRKHKEEIIRIFHDLSKN